MSTAPAPCAPELPSTSTSASASTAAAVSDWRYAEGAAKSSLADNKTDATTDTDTQSTQAASNSTSTAYSYTGSELNGSKSAATEAASAGSSADNANEEKADDSMYECNICLDTAKDAVVSMCGHLFCWPCLHQWLQTRPNRKLCPVCKAAISREKVIPLYGRNSSKQEDPRNKVPPRPAGQRTEPDPHSYGLGFGDGFHMSFGIGAFPFGFFASSFNIGDTRGTANRGTMQYDEDQNLSKLFIYLAILCIAWLLFA